MKRPTVLAVAFSCAVLMSSAGDGPLRRVRVVDFPSTTPIVNLGTEFPGAKGSFRRAGPGGVRHAIDFDIGKGAYVGFEYPGRIAEGARTLEADVTVNGPSRANVFLRVFDAGGQFHYLRHRLPKTGEPQKLTFDLAKFTGHWKGANDGKIRWPLRHFVLAVESCDPKVRSGSFELSDVTVTTSADRAAEPDFLFACRPTRFGALWNASERPSFACAPVVRNVGAGLHALRLSADVTDWLDRPVLKRDFGELVSGSPSEVGFSPDELGGRFGAFRAVFSFACGNEVVGVSTNWFARLMGDRAPKPCSWVGSQLHASHGWGRGDFRFLDILTAAGIGIVRDEVGWAACERQKGVYALPPNFADLLNRLHERGIAINHVMSYVNRIYENPADDDAFAAWCAWMAKRCRGLVRTFEIWNEPQNFHFRQNYGGLDVPDAVWLDRFVKFTQKAAKAIGAADPDASVAVTSEDCWQYLEDMVQRGIARRNDSISFHPYCHGQPRPEREMVFRDNAAALKGLLAAHGGASRYCITEAGWTTYSGKGTYLAIAGGYPRASYVHQAQYLVRMYVLARQIGCDYAIQYDFKNDGPDRSYTEHNFGIVHEDYSPKPSLAAIACLTRTLGEAKPLGDLSFDPSAFRLYRFAAPGGDVTVAWSVEGERDIALPSAQPLGALSFSDLQGNPLAERPVRDGLLHLTECPVYVRGLDAALLAAVPRVEVALNQPRAVSGEPFLLRVSCGGRKPKVAVSLRFDNGEKAPPFASSVRQEGVELLFDPAVWDRFSGRRVVCTLGFDFDGGFRNEQNVRFPVGRIGIPAAENCFRKGGTPVVPVTVFSNTPRVMSVTVRATSPLLPAPASATVSVKPGLPGVWSMPVLRLPRAGGEKVSLEADFGNGRIERNTCVVRAANVPKLAAEPSLSGNPDEWKEAAAPAVPPAWRPGKLPKSPLADDCSVVSRVGWTDAGMAFMVRVKDDSFFQPFSNHGNAGEADSLQLGFTRLATSRCCKITVAAFRDKAGKWMTSVTETVNSLRGHGKIRAAYTPLSETEGVYEVLVPWSRLPTCLETKTVRYAIRVNDNDGDGLRGAWESHGGTAEDNATGRFGTYSLD